MPSQDNKPHTASQKTIGFLPLIRNEILLIENERLLSAIDELIEKTEGEKFYLVMLGLFKRGKSSIINALLRKEIVPTGVVPLTAIITIIEYGSENYAEINFLDGTVKRIPVEEVHKYVAEKENPKNVKQVAFTKIYHNGEILKSVTIIDTPGVGSSLEHNTETTNEFIEKIDAALFILSVDVPITKAEVEFLKKIKTSVPKIIFIMNKTDLFSPEQLEEADDYNRGVLNEICDRKPLEILRLSGKLALEGVIERDETLRKKSGINLLRKRISELSANEKEGILAESLKNRLNNILDGTISMARFRVDSLRLPATDLEKKLGRFRYLLSVMKTEKNDFDILMDGRTKQLQVFVSEKVNQIGNNLVKELETDFAERKEEFLRRLKNENLTSFQEEYIKILRERFDKLKEDLEIYVVEEFKKILRKYGSGANKFMSELLNSLGDMFDYNIAGLSERFDLNVFTSFYYNFETEPTLLGLNSDLIRRKMPSFIIEKLVLNKLLDILIAKINSNCSRVIYDITYRIQESFIKFKFDINDKHDKILGDLEKILNSTLQKKQLAEKDIENEVKQFVESLSRLENIKSRFSSGKS